MATNNDKLNKMSSQLRDKAKEIKQTIKANQVEVSNQLHNTVKEAKRVINTNSGEIPKLSKKQKIATAAISIVLALLTIGVLGTFAAVQSTKIATEKGRDYFIEVEENITADCGLFYNQSSEEFRCKEVAFSGKLSSYETTELRINDKSYDVETKVDDNNFSITKKSFSPSNFHYKSFSFSIDDIKNVSADIELSIYNTVLKKDMATKLVHIEYTITDEEAARIKSRYEEYLIEEAERKAEEEKERAEREAEEKKKQEEAEAAKKAEEEAEKKRQEEEERKRQEEEARKRQEEEEAAKRAEEEKSQSSGSSNSSDPTKIPSEEVSTGLAACKRVLKQQYGITVKDTEFSAGFWSGIDYVWLFRFNSSSGSYTMTTCQYNWKTGTATSEYINW